MGKFLVCGNFSQKSKYLSSTDTLRVSNIERNLWYLLILTAIWAFTKCPSCQYMKWTMIFKSCDIFYCEQNRLIIWYINGVFLNPTYCVCPIRNGLNSNARFLAWTCTRFHNKFIAAFEVKSSIFWTSIFPGRGQQSCINVKELQDCPILNWSSDF